MRGAGRSSGAGALGSLGISVMTFLRIVISLYLLVLSMIFAENQYPLFRIML